MLNVYDTVRRIVYCWTYIMCTINSCWTRDAVRRII